jgi:hypothetical protein
MTDETHKSLAAALLAFQAEAPTLHKNATGQIQSRTYNYVDLHTIVEQITPLLAKHGLTWTTRPTGTHDAPTLTYELLWEGTRRIDHDDDSYDIEPHSEAIAGEMPLYLPDAPTSQTLGSAITYARRYALTAVLNLVADEDDDGQAATSAPARSYGKRQDTGEVATAAQQKKLRAELTKAGIKGTAELAEVTRAVLGNSIIRVDSFTKAQASTMIDRLMQGAIPTGESDVPSDDAPQHEKVPQDDTLPFT